MKIVIDIPEKTIAHIRSDYGHGKGFYPLNEEDKKIVNDAIYFGTPLPEHHGRLISEEDVVSVIMFSKLFDNAKVREVKEALLNIPTIIESDKEVKADE